MNHSTINLVLQSAWQALVLARPSEAGLAAFRDAVFKARADGLPSPESEFASALTDLARMAGTAQLNALALEGIGQQMDILQAALRRAHDEREGDHCPAAVFIPGFGERSDFFAQGLISTGFQILSLPLDANLDLAAALRERMPRSGILLIGEGLLADPLASRAISVVAAEHETDLLVVIAADSELTFEQRVAATEFGAVRLLGLDADLKVLRTLVRSRARDSQLNGYRVLLLDDSRTDAYIAQKYMREEGLEVEHVQAPAEVLDAIERFRPDVVVTDFHMPGANGDQVASVIRQDHEATMPIVFLSGERNAETQLLALSKGADAFVQKPLKRGAFITALKSLIARSKAAEARMRRDPLTGLLNHGQFLGTAARISATSVGEAQSSLVMIDIDHFKSVNDTFGHPVGDRVLVGLAEILSDNLRATDVVGRMGGEEFAVVMVGAGMTEAHSVIDRLRDVFASVQFSAGGEGSDSPVNWFSISFSAGIAPLTGPVACCLRAADEALYKAKNRGRNQVLVATRAVDPGRI